MFSYRVQWLIKCWINETVNKTFNCLGADILKLYTSYRGDRFQVPTRQTGEYKVDVTRHPKFPHCFEHKESWTYNWEILSFYQELYNWFFTLPSYDNHDLHIHVCLLNLPSYDNHDLASHNVCLLNLPSYDNHDFHIYMSLKFTFL
jgi:hypothetical protein